MMAGLASKGNRVNIPEPELGECSFGRRVARSRVSVPAGGRSSGNASEPEDVAGSPGKSSLFFVKDRVRGIGSSGDTDMVPVERRVSGGVRCALGGPGKFGSVTIRSSRVGPYPPSAAGLQGVQPLVDSANVGKGSRQNGSVPSEEGLAPRTGSVGPCVCVVFVFPFRKRAAHVCTRSGEPVRGCSVGVGLGISASLRGHSKTRRAFFRNAVCFFFSSSFCGRGGGRREFFFFSSRSSSRLR
ncbi:hypothetical protein Ahia01_001308500, partial [Argonauta hians]